MVRRWNPLLRSSIAILIVLGLSLVLVHWHPEKAGQECGLCTAHQMPGLQSTTVLLLATPGISEWRPRAIEQLIVFSVSIPSHAERAPPRSLSSIFV